MKRILLVVAYDGTNYCGWQVQKNGETIEGVLNRELSALFGEEIQVIGASRTDSGVHALGNVAVFDTKSRMPGEKISYALNSRIPEDIRIQRSVEVDADFHPRKCACTKHYEYRILNREFELPCERLNTYFYRRPLDVERMRAACPYFLGEHDFKSFCSIHTQAETTVRTIYGLEVRQEGDLIRIQVSGNGFLYNMVRIIAGTLIQIGSGIREPEVVPDIIKSRDRQAAGPTAPAKGLTLLGMDFGK
ncbi:MAG: tRNA pseudouridine(38-40) synthase TruA [Lachnospiraceae bacterium]|jgi:tRNA pseudouridine38-40 synthase|nr:tRNA pseudouridine(38-40) synthase TruA [Lachnospiraceae bacterium]